MPEVFTSGSMESMESVMKEFTQMMGGQSATEVDQAQDLVYKAWESDSIRERIALAEAALKISLHCADAFSLLAQHKAQTKSERLDYYRRATKAGESAIGAEDFESYRGKFWGYLETRPYMRAMEGYADTVWDMGRHDAALNLYEDMLALNPGDNQGIRYVVAQKLLQQLRLDDLRDFLGDYVEENSVDMLYGRALIGFVDADDDAVDIAKQALTCNPFVPKMLAGRAKTVKVGPFMSFGGKDEASVYVRENRDAWQKIDGAIDWLVQVTR